MSMQLSQLKMRRTDSATEEMTNDSSVLMKSVMPLRPIEIGMFVFEACLNQV
jgi:hypothetical protein